MSTNTTLPTGLNVGSTGHTDNHNVIHAAVNELTKDTGLRDASHLLTNGWKLDTASGNPCWVRIRRTVDRVYLYVRGLDGSAATSPRFLTFGADEETQLSTRFSVQNSPSGPKSARSAMQFDDAGDPWAMEVSTTYVQLSTAFGGLSYQRKLGGWEREFQWQTLDPVMPSFLPPAVV